MAAPPKGDEENARTLRLRRWLWFSSSHAPVLPHALVLPPSFSTSLRLAFFVHARAFAFAFFFVAKRIN